MLEPRLMKANLPEPVESGTRGARQYPFARNAATPATSFLAKLNSPNPEIRLGAVSGSAVAGGMPVAPEWRPSGKSYERSPIPRFLEWRR